MRETNPEYDSVFFSEELVRKVIASPQGKAPIPSYSEGLVLERMPEVIILDVTSFGYFVRP